MRKGIESDGEKRQVPKKQESGKKVEQVENVFKVTTVIAKPFHGVCLLVAFCGKRKWFDKFLFIDLVRAKYSQILIERILNYSYIPSKINYSYIFSLFWFAHIFSFY